MSFAKLLGAALLVGLGALSIGCGSDSKGSSGSSTSSFKACFNGVHYTCPDQATYGKCTSSAQDCSGCQHVTPDDPNGVCQ